MRDNSVSVDYNLASSCVLDAWKVHSKHWNTHKKRYTLNAGIDSKEGTPGFQAHVQIKLDL